QTLAVQYKQVKGKKPPTKFIAGHRYLNSRAFRIGFAHWQRVRNSQLGSAEVDEEDVEDVDDSIIRRHLEDALEIQASTRAPLHRVHITRWYVWLGEPAAAALEWFDAAGYHFAWYDVRHCGDDRFVLCHRPRR
ncbi:unnamed protein product, partial [Prorocentrum cordatum]